MYDLYLAELRRFRLPILVGALAHLLLLQFISRSSSLLQQSYFESAPLFGAYLLAGLALALLQVGSYRRPGQWLWLLHRPLPPMRIFAALALAALSLLALLILLPQLLLVLVLDVATTQVVDLRHYLWPPYLLLLAWMAWMGGCHAVLSRSKAAIAVLAIPLLFAVHLISVGWLWLPVLVVLAWLGYVAAAGFRADRETPPKDAPTLLLTALPLQLGLFVLIFHLGQLGLVTGAILVGRDPLNTEYPPEGGLIEAQRMEPARLIAQGLATSTDPRATLWREQLPLLEPVGIGAWLQRYPLRHQFGNLQLPNGWADSERGIVWTFSHDHMRFAGRDPRSGAERGWWGQHGAGDPTPFTEVPIVDEGYLITRQAIADIDTETQTSSELLRLPPGEQFVGLPSSKLGRVLVLSNRHLFAYWPARPDDPAAAPLRLDWQLPLPKGPAALEGVHIAELMDGWLVSFLYGDGHRQIGFSQFTRLAEPEQQVWFVDAEGVATQVGERAIARDYPAFHQLAWWLSPPLHLLSEWPEAMIDKGLSWPLQSDPLPARGDLQLLAAASMLLSLLLGWRWLRDTPLPASRRRFWLASCALLGLPGLLSMLFLQPREPRA